MVIDGRRHHQLVGAGLINEALKAAADGLRRSHKRAGEHAGCLQFFQGRPVGLNVIDWRRELAARAAHSVGESLLGRGEKALRFGVSFGGDHVHADHGVRTIKLRGRLELRAVGLKRRHERVGGEVRSEGIWQPEFRGQLRAEKT